MSLTSARDIYAPKRVFWSLVISLLMTPQNMQASECALFNAVLPQLLPSLIFSTIQFKGDLHCPLVVASVAWGRGRLPMQDVQGPAN